MLAIGYKKSTLLKKIIQIASDLVELNSMLFTYLVRLPKLFLVNQKIINAKKNLKTYYSLHVESPFTEFIKARNR